MTAARRYPARSVSWPRSMEDSKNLQSVKHGAHGAAIVLTTAQQFAGRLEPS